MRSVCPLKKLALLGAECERCLRATDPGKARELQDGDSSFDVLARVRRVNDTALEVAILYFFFERS